MKKRRAKRWLGALALATGAAGAALLLRRKRGTMRDEDKPEGRRERGGPDRWARPGMTVTFRAELMPGRSRSERTFHVSRLLASGRVVLEGFAGEHTESEFEPVQFG